MNPRIIGPETTQPTTRSHHGPPIKLLREESQACHQQALNDFDREISLSEKFPAILLGRVLGVFRKRTNIDQTIIFLQLRFKTCPEKEKVREREKERARERVCVCECMCERERVSEKVFSKSFLF